MVQTRTVSDRLRSPNFRSCNPLTNILHTYALLFQMGNHDLHPCGITVSLSSRDKRVTGSGENFPRLGHSSRYWLTKDLRKRLDKMRTWTLLLSPSVGRRSLEVLAVTQACESTGWNQHLKFSSHRRRGDTSSLYLQILRIRCGWVGFRNFLPSSDLSGKIAHAPSTVHRAGDHRALRF